MVLHVKGFRPKLLIVSFRVIAWNSWFKQLPMWKFFIPKYFYYWKWNFVVYTVWSEHTTFQRTHEDWTSEIVSQHFFFVSISSLEHSEAKIISVTKSFKDFWLIYWSIRTEDQLSCTPNVWEHLNIVQSVFPPNISYRLFLCLERNETMSNVWLWLFCIRIFLTLLHIGYLLL